MFQILTSVKLTTATAASMRPAPTTKAHSHALVKWDSLETVFNAQVSFFVYQIPG